MARTNLKAPAVPAPRTHEGAIAARIKPALELRRTVMACLLWEDTFYESGVSVVERIKALVPLVPAKDVAAIAIEARSSMKLRHVPLLLARELARGTDRAIVADLLPIIIQRADELAEFVAMYWADGRVPLANAVKRGLAAAFPKFNAHALAKYNRADAIKLRDVLFLSHAKPKDDEQAAVWKQLIDGTLPAPDTWEVALSGGADKRETWERLMAENKLGGLAFLRNLRNMEQAGVPKTAVAAYGESVDLSRVLPFRFIAAANAVPSWEDVVEPMMLRALAGQARFTGHTVLLLDGSASMNEKVSAKSEITRRDAACALAILLRELCDDVRVIGFSSVPWDVPPRRGFALRDAIRAKVIAASTMLGRAVRYAQEKPADRIIVITDEQSQDQPPNPIGTGYVINVAGYQNGIGYGAWTHIDGWSEAIIDYIRANEAQPVE